MSMSRRWVLHLEVVLPKYGSWCSVYASPWPSSKYICSLNVSFTCKLSTPLLLASLTLFYSHPQTVHILGVVPSSYNPPFSVDSSTRNNFFQGIFPERNERYHNTFSWLSSDSFTLTYIPHHLPMYHSYTGPRLQTSPALCISRASPTSV